jgi:hypothetical protein
MNVLYVNVSYRVSVLFLTCDVFVTQSLVSRSAGWQSFLTFVTIRSRRLETMRLVLKQNL